MVGNRMGGVWGSRPSMVYASALPSDGSDVSRGCNVVVTSEAPWGTQGTGLDTRAWPPDADHAGSREADAAYRSAPTIASNVRKITILAWLSARVISAPHKGGDTPCARHTGIALRGQLIRPLLGVRLTAQHTATDRQT